MSKPRDLGNGRVLIERMVHFVQWCAWRFWLHRETGRTYFADKLCVWGEWPPESIDGAQIVAQKILTNRQHPKVQFDFPVCDPAQPWDRFSYLESEDLRRHHRDDAFWNPPLPAHRGRSRPDEYRPALERELRAWVDEEAAKCPRVRRGESLPDFRVRYPRYKRFDPGPEPTQEREPCLKR